MHLPPEIMFRHKYTR
uniref:Uncharacterized protein n=1 Tax=Arundo donax TaxID=35708 RepID=A0A0A9FZX0_ARUDO